MDARRVKIIAAQLVKRGFSQEEAQLAASQGPDAIAALNAVGPAGSGDASTASTASSSSGVATITTAPPAFAARPNEDVSWVAAAAAAVDVSWMFRNEDKAQETGETRNTSTAAASSRVGPYTTDGPGVPPPPSPHPAARPVARPVVDVSWMFRNPTLDDEKKAQEIGREYANEVGIAVQAFECQCCFDDVPEMTGLQMSPGTDGCDHVLCPECFKRMISGQIEQKEPCTCPLCPATSPSVVPSWLVRRVLGDELATQLSTIEQIHLGQADGGQLRLWQCPTPDCTNRQVVDEDWDPEQVPGGERIVDCPCCKKRICVRCNVEEHQGFTCQQFKEWRQANDTSEQSYAEMMQQGLIKPCPNCTAPILKNEGCNFMSCPTCNDPDRMCWETGKKRYGPHGCGGGHNCH